MSSEFAVRPFWLAGKLATGDDTLEVTISYDASAMAQVSIPSYDQVQQAVVAAVAAQRETVKLPAHARAAALDHVSRRLRERSDEVAALITAENGKPIKWSKAEVSRAVSVFRWAAEEARRFGGDLQRLDTEPSATGRTGIIRRFSRGPVLGIAPFNFPLNLVAHKVAPAIAVGAPIIVKPAPATPLSALLLGEILAETDLPDGSWSVLTVPNERMHELTADPRLPVISFTGSGRVGAMIKESVPSKHVILELGGNAAVVVLSDYSSDADLEWAASRIATFSNYQGGQSCIAVQRVFADAAIYDRLLEKVVAAVAAQKNGDPRDPSIDVGPLISAAAARRVETWVDEAVGGGAKVLVGGHREGASYAPTVLTEAPPDAKVVREELFGPVLVMERFHSPAEAFRRVNDSDFGLQAGVFTHDLQTAFWAHRELEVGGVVIGDVPSYRADQMPYGGVKGSGVGREGVKYAMQDLTYERILVLTGLDL